ncbi:hypothetical protein AAKU67_003850 [Oxalobacteraceae bacterium GrIS 2.11]
MSTDLTKSSTKISAKISPTKPPQPPQRVSPELKQFLAPPENETTVANQFHQNGFWTPGVNLMTNLRFKGKMLLVTCMFLIPLAITVWFYYSSMVDQIDFSAKERIGVEYNNQVFPVLDLAQQLRRDATVAAASGTAPATMATVSDRLRDAQAKLAEVDKRLGSTLGTSKSYAEAQAAFAKTATASGDEVFKAHTEYVKALITLLGNVADSSNLTLDPDIDSFYLMDSVYGRIPDILENTGKLRGLGLKVLKSGAITPEQQRGLSELIPVAEFQFSNLRDDLAKALASNTSLVETINASQVFDGTAAFFSLARKTVIDAQTFTEEAQSTYVANANKVMEDQYSLAGRLSASLDGLLAKRISTMKSTLNLISLAIAICLALAAYFFYSFFMVTSGGLHLIRTHLQEVARGDLRNRPGKPPGRDECTDVINDLRGTYSNLHELIRTVRHSARALHTTSSEILAASLDLWGLGSNGTETAVKLFEYIESTYCVNIHI